MEISLQGCESLNIIYIHIMLTMEFPEIITPSQPECNQTNSLVKNIENITG